MTFTGPIRRVDGFTRSGKPTHHYADAEGRRVPGVTTLLGDGWPKPALVPWAAKCVAEYAVEQRARIVEVFDAVPDGDLVTEEALADLRRDLMRDLKGAHRRAASKAAAKGTEVHAVAERLVAGHAVEVPEHIADHARHYVEFLERFDPEPVLVETVVYNLPLGYAGTLDLIADMCGERWILDVKTGRSVWPEVAWQLAAYAGASHYLDADGEPHPMIPVDRAGVIHVTESGWSLIPVRIDADVLDGMRAVLEVARLADSARDFLGAPLAQVTA